MTICPDKIWDFQSFLQHTQLSEQKKIHNLLFCAKISLAGQHNRQQSQIYSEPWIYIYSHCLHTIKQYSSNPCKNLIWTFKGNRKKFELSGVKLYRKLSKGSENCFELAGGSSYRGFKLQGVECSFLRDQSSSPQKQTNKQKIMFTKYSWVNLSKEVTFNFVSDSWILPSDIACSERYLLGHLS